MRRAVGEKQKQCSSWLVVQSGSLWQPGARYSHATTGEEMKKKYNPELLAPKFQLTRPSRQLTNSPIPPETLRSYPWTHSLSVPYPPLWLLLTRAHYGLLFSFELDIHHPYISAWAGPSLFTLCLASGLSDTFSKSKLINLIVTGEWQELCGGNVSLSTRSQTLFFFPDLCAEFLASRPISPNIPQAPPYFLSPQPQPFLVKLESDTSMCWAVQRSRPLVTPNPLFLLCPLLLSSIKQQFLLLFPPNSLWNLSLLSQPCHSYLWTSKSQCLFWFPTSNITPSAVKFNVTSGFLASFTEGFPATNSHDDNGLLLSHFS